MLNWKRTALLSILAVLALASGFANANMWRPAPGNAPLSMQAPTPFRPATSYQPYSMAQQQMQQNFRSRPILPAYGYRPPVQQRQVMPGYPGYAAGFQPFQQMAYQPMPRPMQGYMQPVRRTTVKPPMFARQYAWRPAANQWMPNFNARPMRPMVQNTRWVDRRDQGRFRPLAPMPHMGVTPRPAFASGLPKPGFAPYVLHPQQDMRTFRTRPMPAPYYPLPNPHRWDAQAYRPFQHYVPNEYRPNDTLAYENWIAPYYPAPYQRGAYPPQPTYYPNGRIPPLYYPPQQNLRMPAEENWWAVDLDKSGWQACAQCGSMSENKIPRYSEYDYSYR